MRLHTLRCLAIMLTATMLFCGLPSPAPAADGALMTVVKKFLTQDNWKFTQLEAKPMLRMGFKGSESSWTCIVQVDEERKQVYFYSVLPANVPADKRALGAEYLTRANYGLKMGNFEMDWSDGQVLYKTSVNVEGGELAGPMVKALLYTNVLTVDRYLGGLIGVLAGKLTPTQAIAEAEKK